MSSMDSCNDYLADAMCTQIIGDHSQVQMMLFIQFIFQTGSAGPDDPMSSCTVVVSGI